MKKIALVFPILLIFAFIGCEKDYGEDIKNWGVNDLAYCSNLDLETSFNKNTIDSIAIECAEFHGFVLNALLCDSTIWDKHSDELLNEILCVIKNNFQKLELPHSSLFLADCKIDYIEFSNVIDMDSIGNNEFFIQNFDNQKYSSFNLQEITLLCRTIWPLLEESLITSNSMEEVEEKYKKRIVSLTDTITDVNTYFCISMAAAVCFNSFETWSILFCGEINEKSAFWDKVKKTAGKIQMYAEADLEGAAYGAIAGATELAIVGGITGGLPGAAAGAAAGAVGGSFGGAIASSAKFYADRH